MLLSKQGEKPFFSTELLYHFILIRDGSLCLGVWFNEDSVHVNFNLKGV